VCGTEGSLDIQNRAVNLQTAQRLVMCEHLMTPQRTVAGDEIIIYDPKIVYSNSLFIWLLDNKQMFLGPISAHAKSLKTQ
jgi:hypothetical protein